MQPTIRRKAPPILLTGLGLGLSLGLSACVSMSSLQTARTLEKGKAEWTAGGGTYSSGAVTDAVKDDGAVAEKLSIPFLEVTYRQGIAKDWDFGLKATVIGSLTGDVKYGLIQDEKFALSTGAGLGYFSVETKVADAKSSTTVYDVTIPLLASYDFTKSFSLYGGPKYVSRFISGSGSNGQTSLAGGTAGVKLGESWGAYLEGSYYKNLGKSSFSGTQFNVALFWDANPLF